MLSPEKIKQLFDQILIGQKAMITTQENKHQEVIIADKYFMGGNIIVDAVTVAENRQLFEIAVFDFASGKQIVRPVA